ncbi:MAG: oligosaccharide flippase family protein [Chloroflexi bacterium]|nr:oligosaccharide flippase family protein [Chloroflexota bacterium]
MTSSTGTSARPVLSTISGLEPISEISLRTNFFWTLAGNVIYAGSQWGILVVLSKLGTPEMVGQFALGLAIANPIVFFANLELRAVQATDARHEYPFRDYLGLRLLTTLVALLVIAGISVAGGYRRETTALIMAIGLAKSIETFSDILYGLMQQHEKMGLIARSMMLKGPLSLIALTIGVYLTGSVVGAAAGLALAWTVLLVIYDIRNTRLLLKTYPQPTNQESRAERLRPRSRLADLRKLALFALPLGFAAMLIALNTGLPRYFIERVLGERELGFYAAMAYLMTAGTTVIAALGQSASPRLAKYYAAENHVAFRNLLLKLVGFGVLLGVAGILAALAGGREILTILYRPEYATQTDTFVWLMVAAGVTYVAACLGYGLTALRLIKIQPFIFAGTALLLLVLCAVLIPRHGTLGAAWATGIAVCVQAVVSYLVIRRRSC